MRGPSRRRARCCRRPISSPAAPPGARFSPAWKRPGSKFLDAAMGGARGTACPLPRPDQAVILASIVEKETALPDERRHIAAVFLNRLKAGMKLQSDPTIIYGISKGYPLGRPHPRKRDRGRHALQHLCDPGPAADADLQSRQGFAGRGASKPEDSDDLYFVANGKGGHVFAATDGRTSAQCRGLARDRAGEGTRRRTAKPPSRTRPSKATKHRRSQDKVTGARALSKFPHLRRSRHDHRQHDRLRRKHGQP